MHHPVSTKYPNGNTTAYLKDITQFVDVVARNLESVVFPRPQHRYAAGVHVLLISWADDDLKSENDLKRLQKIFIKTYGYTAEHYKIPSENLPEWELEFQLMKTRKQYGMESDSLLIIVYGGHGAIRERDQHSIWKAWQWAPLDSNVTRSPELDWTELQRTVMCAKGDVLFILDCCYAGGAVREQYKGRRELMLASGKTEKASNQNTFTKALIDELAELRGEACTVGMLHSRLVQNQSIHNLKPSPLWTLAGTEPAGIVLAPQPTSQAGGVQPSGTQQHAQKISSTRSVQGLIDTKCRILISVSLTELGNKPMAESWIEWFRDHAPASVAAVKLLGTVIRPEAAFISDSTYMVVSVPVAVWNAMPADPAIGFLAIVRSANLLSQESGATHTAEVAAENSDGKEPLNVTQRLLGVPANIDVALEDINRPESGLTQDTPTFPSQPARQAEVFHGPPPELTSAQKEKLSHSRVRPAVRYDYWFKRASRKFVVCCDGEDTGRGRFDSNVTRLASVVADLDDDYSLQVVYWNTEPPCSVLDASSHILFGLLLCSLTLVGVAFLCAANLWRTVLELTHGLKPAHLINTTAWVSLTACMMLLMRPLYVHAYHQIRTSRLPGRIRQVYSFLAFNVHHSRMLDGSDTIFLVGSSSGSAVALQVAEMIGSIGLPTKFGSQYLDDIIYDWQCEGTSKPILFAKLADRAGVCRGMLEPERYSDVQRWLEDLAARARKSSTVQARREYVEYFCRALRQYGLTKTIEISCLALFDGSPQFLTPTAPACVGSRHSEADSGLNAARAFQALALDETRLSLAPTKLKLEYTAPRFCQVWFPGTHEELVGTTQQRVISNQALAWMMDKLSGEGTEDYRHVNFIKFDSYGVPDPFTWHEWMEPLSADWQRRWTVPIRSEITLPQWTVGYRPRRPTASPSEGDPWEYIHPFVRLRMKFGGMEPVADWSQAFPWKGWDIAPYLDLPHLLAVKVFRRRDPKGWSYRPDERKNGPIYRWTLKKSYSMHKSPNHYAESVSWNCYPDSTVMWESQLGRYERMLLDRDRDVIAALLGP
ncbi:hypothetical protein LTR56_021631 [Elasticomyces elasticus]|nr:hypothetical protein LTR56_021631 [Elasticomyces elasticus]KAK5759013.1 hypothetical protein LTS12_010785 [Elasticomyces elasticus]